MAAHNDIATARGGVTLTPDNSNDLARGSCRALYIGVAGDVKVDLVDGSTVTFVAVANGIFPVQAKRVYATGTAATNIVALY